MYDGRVVRAVAGRVLLERSRIKRGARARARVGAGVEIPAVLVPLVRGV